MWLSVRDMEGSGCLNMLVSPSWVTSGFILECEFHLLVIGPLPHFPGWHDYQCWHSVSVHATLGKTKRARVSRCLPSSERHVCGPDLGSPSLCSSGLCWPAESGKRATPLGISSLTGALCGHGAGILCSNAHFDNHATTVGVGWRAWCFSPLLAGGAALSWVSKSF